MKKLLVVLMAFLIVFTAFSCAEYDYSYSSETSFTKSIAETSAEISSESTSSIELLQPSSDLESSLIESSKEVSSKETSSKITSSVAEYTPSERMVWIPQSGKKYHNNPSCSGMKNPSQVTITRAKNLGYTACKKCC